METTRPNPLQWVRYAYGGRWRYGLRVVAQTLPWLAVVFVVLTVFTPLQVGW